MKPGDLITQRSTVHGVPGYYLILAYELDMINMPCFIILIGDRTTVWTVDYTESYFRVVKT